MNEGGIRGDSEIALCPTNSHGTVDLKRAQ